MPFRHRLRYYTGTGHVIVCFLHADTALWTPNLSFSLVLPYTPSKVVQGYVLARENTYSPSPCYSSSGPTLFQWLTDRCNGKVACTRDPGISLVTNPNADKRVQIW